MQLLYNRPHLLRPSNSQVKLQRAEKNARLQGLASQGGGLFHPSSFIFSPRRSEIQRTGFQNHGEMAQRKPTRLKMRDGSNPPRFAERISPPSLFHEPPRSTRYCPLPGPCGLLEGELA